MVYQWHTQLLAETIQFFPFIYVLYFGQYISLCLGFINIPLQYLIYHLQQCIFYPRKCWQCLFCTFQAFEYSHAFLYLLEYIKINIVITILTFLSTDSINCVISGAFTYYWAFSLSGSETIAAFGLRLLGPIIEAYSSEFSYLMYDKGLFLFCFVFSFPFQLMGN